VSNAFSERFVRTVRAECLDWVLIWNRRHLERILSAYVKHYNGARPHRGIHPEMPIPRPVPAELTGPVERVDVLGRLIHEYQRAA
jgi:putative transposase